MQTPSSGTNIVAFQENWCTGLCTSSCRSPYLVGLFPEPTQPERTTGKQWVEQTDPWSVPSWNKNWACPEHGISSRLHAQGTGVGESSLSARGGCKLAGEMKGHTGQGKIQGKPGHWWWRDEWEVWPAHLSEPRGLNASTGRWCWICARAWSRGCGVTGEDEALNPNHTPTMRHTGPGCVWPRYSWD